MSLGIQPQNPNLTGSQSQEPAGAGCHAGPTVRLSVTHGLKQYDVSVPPQFSIGELKKVLTQQSGLDPANQKLLFRGKEKEDSELLHMSGIKDMARLVLLEAPRSQEQVVEEEKMDPEVARECEAIARVRAEVDKIADKVSTLEAAVNGHKKVDEKEFTVLTELLMIQLLKLDGIEAEGEARVQRKKEVKRIQNMVEAMDALKARYNNPFLDQSRSVEVATQWATFDSGSGQAPQTHAPQSFTQVTENWERFD
ncbi:BAG family molecular chaperone regulator 2 [Rhynchospora pubera]|uniref:BAG family molecular chaperone regulator 2 n=1 Tax=Rhynchospora pubera TaxID=906938 RepID=A0AAV8F072_9POAL|nr:BAG family molecular chaperone regulator 2 [Rhynchospora pubera]